MEFARDQFALNEKVEGVTIREHLQAIWDKTGVAPERLANAPKCPKSLAYLWTLFTRLRRRCTPSMGASRILYTDIAAFQAVTGERLLAWEVDVIERLDEALLGAAHGS